jgi:hypothetical protein
MREQFQKRPGDRTPVEEIRTGMSALGPLAAICFDAAAFLIARV